MDLQLTRKGRDRRLRETDILKAAEHVFATQGYHKATIAEIAQKSQYGVGTVYLYFKDKQTLFSRLVEEKVEQMISFIKEEVAKSKNVIERIEALVKSHLQFFDENRDFFQIHFTERRAFKGTSQDKIDERIINRYLKYTDFVVQLIKKAIAERKLKNFNPNSLAFTLIGNINSMIFRSLMESKVKEPLLNYKDFILELFLNGAARK